jgi:hypothetical protein
MELSSDLSAEALGAKADSIFKQLRQTPAISRRDEMADYAEFIIGRPFARPVG